jgi:DNA (cytosine-5)-methyltransferase 1|tara:strand:+ start:512 stop:1165 length:654 start_codon:yes stop_codon:yes gene_type:complete
MKILNLYACLGGNRYKWNEVDEDIQVTAVEWDKELARMYQERFPDDNVIVADAHKYLLDHYKEFDFIWSSPPCPTHSKARFARRNTTEAKFPDLDLYAEIIFLKHNFKGKFVVENVIPYYEPLIPAKKIGRHLYWTNFALPNNLQERKGGIIEGKNEVKKLCEFHDIDISSYKGNQRMDKIARNLVDYEAGKTILMTVMGIERKSNVNQMNIFDTVL